MKFIVRTDASLKIGTGHVMRCLTLAKALRYRGAECSFVCRKHEGHLIEMIRREGFECIALAKSTETSEMDDAEGPCLMHADWLGATWKLDAEQTIEALGAKIVDWLVVDHYALDKRWQETLRPYAKKIMVIDDLADRHHDCDLLLDQNLVANFETRYQYLLPDHCATLLGPQYALLQPEYAELHSVAAPRVGPVKRILVFFGGTDQHHLTMRAVSAFFELKRNDIRLDVVMSSPSQHVAEIQELTKPHTNITVHEKLPSLASLILQADLAIGASGATAWERCALGLPSLVITLAENQKPVAAELNEQGIVRWLGHFDAVTDDSLKEELSKAIGCHDLYDWSSKCLLLGDPHGTKRTCCQILQH